MVKGRVIESMKNKVTYLFSAVFLSFLLGACTEQTSETGAQKEEKANDVKEEQTTGTEGNEAEDAYATQWSYDEDTGPEQWGNSTMLT